ncbi:hypothetical protein cypCar_00047649 [Cyprinus carpio]|nr:hypothetical protein cypCar_00047649 [Cyprinus carpio]
MIDSPGTVAAPSNPGVAMALRSLQVEEKEESPLEAVRTLLKQCNQQHVCDFPNLASSISFNSRGPTTGVLNVSELTKETITTTAKEEADEKEMDVTVNTEEPEVETLVSMMVTQIHKSTKKRKDKPTNKAKFVPVNIDLTSVQHNNDDAYDFNTDFV